MLIAALLYFFVGLFGFGGGDAPLVIDIKKPLKEHVADPDRKAKALAINESMQDQAKAYSDDFAATRKELLALQTKRLSSEADFALVFAAADAKRTALRTQLLNERLALKALITTEEWAKIYANAPTETPASDN